MNSPRSKNEKLALSVQVKAAREARMTWFLKSRREARDTKYAERRRSLNDSGHSHKDGELPGECVEVVEKLATELKGSKGNKEECLAELSQMFEKGPEYVSAFLKVNQGFSALESCLVAFMHENTVLEAAACFTYLSCAGHRICMRIANHVGVYLILYLKNRWPFLQETCAYVLRNLCLDGPEVCSVLQKQGFVRAACDAVVSIEESKTDDFVAPSCLYALCSYLATMSDPEQMPNVQLPEPDFVRQMAAAARANPGKPHFHSFLFHMSPFPGWRPDPQTISDIFTAFGAFSVRPTLPFVHLLRTIGNLFSISDNWNTLASVDQPTAEKLASGLELAFSEPSLRVQAAWVVTQVGSFVVEGGHSGTPVEKVISVSELKDRVVEYLKSVENDDVMLVE